MLAHCVDTIGANRVVFGTDFPHVDHDAGILERLFGRDAPLTAEVLRAALWDNPARLMGLPDAARSRPLGGA